MSSLPTIIRTRSASDSASELSNNEGEQTPTSSSTILNVYPDGVDAAPKPKMSPTLQSMLTENKRPPLNDETPESKKHLEVSQ